MNIIAGKTSSPKISDVEQERRYALQRTKPRVYDKVMQYKDKVARGESIAILQLQYDYTCNMQCGHCCITGLRRPKGGRCFTPESVAQLCDQADAMGLAHLVLTGGEPLCFPDFEDVIKSVGPHRFYISCDTNGILLTDKRARHLKDLGIDKIQLSVDALHCNKSIADFGIKYAQAAGLAIIIQTVVDKSRVRSKEFIQFIEHYNSKGVPVFVTYAKPVGAWAGRTDMLIDRADMDYVRELEQQHDVFTHLTPSYGLNLGCIAVKRMVSITKYGDVMFCPYVHVSFGNFFEEGLDTIIARGMQYVAGRVDTCLIAEDRMFIRKLANATKGKALPISYRDFF